MTRKLLTLAALAAGFAAFAGAAYADPMIASGSALSLNGSDSYTATEIDFSNPANVGSATGSFSELVTPCNGCVTMASSFSTSTATPFQLFTLTDGTNTASLSVTSDTFNQTGSGVFSNLTVTGTGVLSLTGFAPTQGYYILTTQGPQQTSVTFSVTALPVPEPGTLALFGAALLGLGFVARRKQRI